jgi:hypothetical protein
LPSDVVPIARATAMSLALMAVLGCRPSAAPDRDDHPAATSERVLATLAMLPADARIVASVDLASLRGRPLWGALLPALTRHAQHVLAGMSAATGFDPSRQARHLVVALPNEPAPDRRFFLVIDAEALDEGRVTAWLRARLGDGAAILVRDQHQIVIAQGAWAASVHALARDTRLAPSAAEQPELRHLCLRAAAGHALWLAAVVPPALRHRQLHQDELAEVGAIARLAAYLDDGGELRAGIVAELGNSHDVGPLARRLDGYLGQARRQPEMLWRGLSPYLDGIHVVADQAAVKATMTLPASQIGDLVERMEALAQTARTQ